MTLPILPVWGVGPWGFNAQYIDTLMYSSSIFTDKGPIAKPELTLQSGSGGTIQTQTTTHYGTVTLNEVVLPGGSFSTSDVGKYLQLSGTTVNSGSYRVLSVVTPTRLKLDANLRLPDPSNGSLVWRLYDPRTGEIADSPDDVVVLVNNVQVTPLAVIGLLGQILLPAVPSSTDDVKVTYSWIPDPVVDIQRLNSPEFKLNGWVNDVGRTGSTQHTYRYRNVLVTPSTFTSNDLRADMAQPLLRELHYRAYERAYTAALNDPSLLLFNTPIHRIAYPPLSRQVAESSVSYTASTLPESDLVAPWVRYGVGLASASGGNLLVQDNTEGPYPSGNPLYWSRDADFTFTHIFAYTWRMQIVSSNPSGVFTGVCTGWSDDEKAVVIGYLQDGSTKKFGILKKDSDPSFATSWTGGISGNTSTGAPADLDWSVIRSYRVFRDRDGVVKVYVDGSVSEILRITADELPYLEEVNAPFSDLQGVFFGSLSREASNVSSWDFVRYAILPSNVSQTLPAIYVSYEGTDLPEDASSPWTPVGSHGNESLSSGSLLLDSTGLSTAGDVGLMNGNFRGYTRVEPLLATSSDVVLDFAPQLRTYTHGINPNAVTVALDDGYRLMQVCFFPSQAQPKYSYSGRSLPQDSVPSSWAPFGGQSASMLGQVLVIDDTSLLDGLVYALEDLAPNGSPSRVLESVNDYYIEFKLKVTSYSPDGAGFCGATVDTYDGTKAIGVLLRDVLGSRKLAFHSDGNILTQFNFDWFDGEVHVIRVVKNTLGNLVTLFVDNNLVGSHPYTSFSASAGNPTISFGSSTAASSGSLSSVQWHYVNVWRGQPSSGVRKYVGLWKGTDENSLTGYHLPEKANGHAAIAGNSLTDVSASFVSAGVAVGDDLVVDDGPNKGVYSVASVSPTTVTLTIPFPFNPSEVDYRIPLQVDWTSSHKYRLMRAEGVVSLTLDASPAPLLRVDYSEVALPSSSYGFPYQVNGTLPSVSWGSFDPANLSQTAWDFVRYGVRTSVDGSRIVPPHQTFNQRNVMSSPEHLSGSVAHDHTQFSSSSTGVPYPWNEYVENPLVKAFTQLNEGTPLVPSTQSYELRRPTPEFTFLSGLNRPEDVLNDGERFILNDGATEVRLIVPDDVLYNCLQVVEQTTGEENYLAPLSDEYNPIALRKLNWQKEVCGTYEGNVLPESDPGFGTSWVLESDDPGAVSASVFSGVLTYSSGVSTGNTIYRNPTPLTDPVGLSTKVEFRLKVANDASGGTGDTGIRFGFSAFGLITAALAFVTTPYGDREVRLLDLNTNTIVSSILFDFLDGNFHVYQLIKHVDGSVEFLVDP